LLPWLEFTIKGLEQGSSDPD